jgi:hypothetical protein
MGSMLRHPKTTQERRRVEIDRLYVRPKRHRLPHAWDDLFRRDLNDRSWKQHRMFQWKPTGLDPAP